MPSTAVLVVSLVPVLFFTLWFLSSTVSPPSIPNSLRNKRIILLIAHPDDESMFFSPALQALTQPSMGNHLKILCMSTGNADGLGETRRQELEAAALTIGVRRREDVFVMDDERFKDGMKEEWDPREIARVLAQAFAPQLITPAAPTSTSSTSKTSSKSSKDKKEKEKERDKDKDKKKSSSSSFLSSSKHSKSSSKSTSKTSSTASTKSSTSVPTPIIPAGPRASIDVLLTFDKKGISSHPNHIALYHGACVFLQQIMRDHIGYRCPVDLYTLSTINILRKYSFIFDLLTTYISGIAGSIRDSWTKSKAARAGKDPREDRVIFVSGVPGYMRARKAMVSGHASQMVWFRWGWIGLGRYMVINDLKRETVPGT